MIHKNKKGLIKNKGEKMKKLIVTFQLKTIGFKSGKVVRVKDGDSYVFYGDTKKECEQQARDKFRWNGYKKVWEEETEE